MLLVTTTNIRLCFKMARSGKHVAYDRITTELRREKCFAAQAPEIPSVMPNLSLGRLLGHTSFRRKPIDRQTFGRLVRYNKSGPSGPNEGGSC